jgi:hypothetical protein
MTRAGWLAIGGFNERVRFAKIHKDGQFCINACLEGYTFESLGPTYHIDHDGSYANVGTKLGDPNAPYGPEWDYNTRYRNPRSWGISAAIDEPGPNGRVVAHHPSTHGPLLSVIVPDLREQSLAAAVNAALATANGQFVAVTTDPSLHAFGGSDALVRVLTDTTAGLIAPASMLVQHSRLGPVPSPGAPYVIRRDVVDALTEWDETEADPAIAFWLRAAELAEVATVLEGHAGQLPAVMPVLTAGLQIATLARRGGEMPRTLLDEAVREHFAATRSIHTMLRQWIATVAPDTDALCAIAGPDWATPVLLELVQSEDRMLAGVYTAVANEEGSWRWGHKLRPLKELGYTKPTYVLAGADARLAGRLRAMGCPSEVHVVTPVDDPDRTAPAAEIDSLRRAQARDLAAGNITALQARLPLLALLDGERGWSHKYDAAQAHERAKLPAAALELYREITAECKNDPPLSMRAAFHTARLLIARGAAQQASPLLAKILKNNPGHRAARELFDQITSQRLTA